MKIWKRFAVGLLTAALTLSLLTACGDSGGGSNGGGNSGNANPPAASTGGQDNESSSDSTIQEPDKTLTWANSKTNAYFSRLGVTRENFYAELESQQGGRNFAFRVSARGNRASYTVIEDDCTCSVDEQGNVYWFDGANKEVNVDKAGTSAAQNKTKQIKQNVYGYVMIPKANEVVSITAGEYQGAYMESVRVASAEAGVGTYDYVFDGDNLAFIIMQHYGVKNTITTLYANPSDKVIGFPDWYSENIGASKASQYFKAKGMTENNLYVDMQLINYSNGHIILTARGKEAFELGTNTLNPPDGSGSYIDAVGNIYGFYCLNKIYFKQGTTVENPQEEQNIRTAGGYFMIPSASNCYWYSMGTSKVDGKEYYTEVFQTGTTNHPDESYEYLFQGNELVYMRHGGATIKVNEISGTPRTDLLKIPDGYTDTTNS